MNRVILMGRLTRDPNVTYSQKDNSAIARFTIAVDRRFARRDAADGQQTADFIGCVCFGKQAEFAEKYLRQGTKIACQGRIQTGSYTNKDGQKVYTTDVVLDDVEFAGEEGYEGSYDLLDEEGYAGEYDDAYEGDADEYSAYSSETEE